MDIDRNWKVQVGLNFSPTVIAQVWIGHCRFPNIVQKCSFFCFFLLFFLDHHCLKVIAEKKEKKKSYDIGMTLRKDEGRGLLRSVVSD